MDSRRGRGKERVFEEGKVDSNSMSSSRTYNKEVFVDNYVDAREGVQGLRPEQSGASRETYRRFSQFPIDNWMAGNDLDMNTSRSTSVNSSVRDISAQLKNFAGSLRSRESMDQWGFEREQFEGSYASPRLVAEWGRSPTSAYPDEGPSSYKLDSFDGHGEQNYSGNLAEVENVEQDRAVLLRKLDELKDQLTSKTYNVADKPREVIPVERSRTPPDRYGDQLTYNLSVQPYPVEQQMPRPPHFNYSNGPVPFMDHRNMEMQNFYPPQRHPLNVIPEYEDPSRPHMQRRPPHHPLQSPRPPPHDYFTGQQMDFNLNSHPHENGFQFHSPACSCLACYNHNWGVSPQVTPADFGDRRVPNAPMNLNSYQHVNPATFVPHDYNPRHANPPPLQRRWQSDLDSDTDGYGDRNPQSAMAVNRHGRILIPIAGGAPFFTCFSCFELLKLPRKLSKTNQLKLRCGSCSTVIYLQIKNKKLITSVPKDSKKLSYDVDQSTNEVFKGRVLSSDSSPKAGDTNSYGDDADLSRHNLQFMDTKDHSLREDRRLNLDESEKSQGLTSSSSVSSKEEEEISDSMIANIHISDSTKLPTKESSFSPTPPGSHLWQQSDSPSKHEISRDGKGNKSEAANQEKALFSKNTSQQNYLNDRSVETEVDDSFNDYLNTSISQDSAERSKEEDRLKVGKGADSFLMGLIKKSFRDSSKSSQVVGRTRPSVSINGRPLPDHVVKKAEKLAGPIQPGNYWYDFRAGFWGVMGQTCLGIIPPLIEEFYYPMPTNCAAGNTGVYVNGRELHERDLDLLARRGLPTTREKFYIIEISGRVVDEDSGEELDNLGKLAPTIEKVKHGFGMKVPRMAV